MKKIAKKTLERFCGELPTRAPLPPALTLLNSPAFFPRRTARRVSTSPESSEASNHASKPSKPQMLSPHSYLRRGPAHFQRHDVVRLGRVLLPVEAAQVDLLLGVPDVGLPLARAPFVLEEREGGRRWMSLAFDALAAQNPVRSSLPPFTTHLCSVTPFHPEVAPGRLGGRTLTVESRVTPAVRLGGAGAVVDGAGAEGAGAARTAAAAASWELADTCKGASVPAIPTPPPPPLPRR